MLLLFYILVFGCKVCGILAPHNRLTHTPISKGDVFQSFNQWTARELSD